MRIRTHLNPFHYTQRFDKKPMSEFFSPFYGNVDVEMGFGYGDFMAYYAALYPERCIVGFEINVKLSEFAHKTISEKKLTNALPLWGNGLYGLHDMFDDQSIDRLFVFHPDPWFKNRHIKRRVVNPEFLQLAHKKLKSGSCLYVATDVPELWQAMLKTIEESKLFTLVKDHEFWDACYHTKWKERSLEKEKMLFFGTFQRTITINEPL